MLTEIVFGFVVFAKPIRIIVTSNAELILFRLLDWTLEYLKILSISFQFLMKKWRQEFSSIQRATDSLAKKFSYS